MLNYNKTKNFQPLKGYLHLQKAFIHLNSSLKDNVDSLKNLSKIFSLGFQHFFSSVFE